MGTCTLFSFFSPSQARRPTHKPRPSFGLSIPLNVAHYSHCSPRSGYSLRSRPRWWWWRRKRLWKEPIQVRSLRWCRERRADSRFRWEAKNICLPNGGPNNPSNPPHNTDCPFHWSWHSGKGCCAPHQPPNTLPPPQCDKGWRWSPATLCCNPPPTPPTTTKPPAPSKTPDCDDDKDGRGDHDGRNNNGNHHKRINTQKRDLRSRNLAPCPKGRSACPVTSLIGGDYECVDTLVDLDNCGGCATLGEGQNCNVIPGVWNVGCEQSACKSKSFHHPRPWVNLTAPDSLYLRGRLHSFRGRKVLQCPLNTLVVRSSAERLRRRLAKRPRPGSSLPMTRSPDLPFWITS